MHGQVAVGVRHAALVTRSGEVYAWGDSAGGRLGLGRALEGSAPPQRVHMLWGQPVKRLACSGAPLRLSFCLLSKCMMRCGTGLAA